MSIIQDQFIDARLYVGDTQAVAAFKCKCGLSTISKLENHGVLSDRVEAITANIRKYIKRNHPDNQKEQV